MVYLINQSFRKYYYANKCSCATMFCLFMHAVAILIAFFLAFATNNFWIRKNEITEQPSVNFRDEIIIYNLENGVSRGYSSVSDLNSIFDNKIISPSVKSLSLDENQDGLPDTFKFDISFYSSASTLTNSQIYLFFDYGLESRAKVQMQDFIRIDLTSASGISRAQVIGDIELRQRSALQASSVTRNIYNQSLFNDPTQNINVAAFLENKLNRNESIYCGNCQSFVSPGNGASNVKINVQLRVPTEQLVVYVPTVLENLKFSWIQFITLYFPLYLIANLIVTFAFKNQIFATQQVNDLPNRKIQ